MTTLEIKEYYDHDRAMEDIRGWNPDISIDLMRQPGLFAYYNSLLVKAELQHDRLENAAEIIAAQLDTVYRKEASDAGTKITEGQIKSKVAASAQMRKVLDLVRQARAQVGYLKGTCESLRHRRDALTNMCLNMREELKGSPTVMKTSMKENQSERLKRLALLDAPNVD